MKRFAVLVSKPAEEESDAAFRYMRVDSPVAAERWRRGIGKATESLALAPRRCRAAPESDEVDYELRQLWYGKYRILFTIDEDCVVILHVLHGARDRISPDEILPPE